MWKGHSQETVIGSSCARTGNQILRADTQVIRPKCCVRSDENWSGYPSVTECAQRVLLTYQNKEGTGCEHWENTITMVLINEVFL